MAIPQLYMFDLKTGEYLGRRAATKRPNGDYVLEALGTTAVAPPVVEEGMAQWDGSRWRIVEDHRQRTDDSGQKYGGTPFWLPGDSWMAEPRYVSELGPLPDGAMLVRPERPLSEYRADKAALVVSEYARALTATLTMPMENPLQIDVGVSTALFAAEDPEGLHNVQAILATKRDSLLDAVASAADIETLNNIEIRYPV